MVIEEFGGAHGVRDEKRLMSAAKAPFQDVFGKELYPTLFAKGAVYIKSIIADHLFVDGNKRTAVTVAVVFLRRNGYQLTATPIELADYAVSVATNKTDIKEIDIWLKKNSQKA